MTSKDDLAARRLKLSPAKRALLEKRVAGNQQPAHPHQRITPRPSEEPLELSCAQDRLWFLHELDPSNPSYNVFKSMRLQGVLHLDKFEQAIQEVIQRHEVLRTIFVQQEGKPLPVIIHNLKAKVSLINLTHHPFPLREQLLKSVLKQEARRHFALNQGPLIRAVLFKLDVNHHVFLLTVHHIVSDQWSLDIFFQEINSLYKAFLQNKPSPLPELSLQYADYAYWQKRGLQEEAMQQQRAYWKTKLERLPTPIQLPFSRVKKRSHSTSGGLRSLEITSVISTRLQSLRKQQNTTLFSLLLAAFVTLLYRYTGQTDIAVGTPIANRNQEDFHDLIGFFLNTLVLRFDLSTTPNFMEFTKYVHEEVMDAFANQDFPFEKLVAELKPDRDSWSNPFFNIMYVFESHTESMKGLQNIQTTPIDVDIETSKFDLTLFVNERQKNISLALEYNSDLFDDMTIVQILGNFTTLLEGISGHPNQTLSELPLLRSEELKQIDANTNQKVFGHSSVQCWLDWFDEQVLRNPHAQAVVNGPCSLDYAQLNGQANQLAQFLRKHGIGPDCLVAILSDRSVEMIVGLLGVLKAGGAYVPLDPMYPHARLARILEDTRASFVLTQQKHVEKLSEFAVQSVCLDSDWEKIAQHVASDPPENIFLPHHLAYVIYTSGSTGQPKGVMVTHGNLASSNQARLEYYTQEVQRFLLLSSLAFDSSIAGIFWTLSCGGTLFIPEEGMYLDPDYLVDLIQDNHVSHVLCIPSLYQLLLSSESRLPTALTTTILAGESCPIDLVHKHFQSLPQAALFNEYGPTEATVWSTVFDCRTEIRSDTVPIGQPIPRTQAYVLGTDKQPVPAGIAGELYIAGPGVARGYLNDPELTQRRFEPNPFAEGSEELMYKTGDLVRCLPDGNLEFLGRSDRQTKILGRRVDLGDIESHLRLYPEVQEAAVLIHDGREGNQPSLNDRVSDTDDDVLIDQLSLLPTEKTNQLLEEIERLSQEDVHYMIQKNDERHSSQPSGRGMSDGDPSGA